MLIIDFVQGKLMSEINPDLQAPLNSDSVQRICSASAELSIPKATQVFITPNPALGEDSTSGNQDDSSSSGNSTGGDSTGGSTDGSTGGSGSPTDT